MTSRNPVRPGTRSVPHPPPLALQPFHAQGGSKSLCKQEGTDASSGRPCSSATGLCYYFRESSRPAKIFEPSQSGANTEDTEVTEVRDADGWADLPALVAAGLGMV